MKPNKTLLIVALFVAGFSLAWMIRRGEAPAAKQTEAETPTGSVARKPDGTTRQDDDPRMKRLVREYLAGRSPDVAKLDYRKMIEEFFKNPDGLDEIELLWKAEKLVADWYEADPNAALLWVLSQQNPRRTSFMLTSIVGRLSETDLDAALTLAKRYGADEGRHLEMPRQLKEKLGKTDAEEFLRVTGSFTQYLGLSGGMAEFGDGFDFQRALDGLAEMKAGLEEGVNPAYVPTNLLSEWAKRDWDAAWDWALNTKDQADLSGLAKGAAATVPTQEYAGLAAFIAAIPDREPERNAIQAWDVLSARASPALFSSFLDQAPGGRQENLSRILAASFNYGGDGYDDAQEILISQMTPAERLAAFQSEPVRQVDPGRRQDYSDLLRRLGHNDGEIRRMLPPETGQQPGNPND